ncbi:MAG: RNA 2',3'-cyclic phosphodiesterase [Chloroflexi bacterium]|nr:RNA 2',3'-cyclic phosphodiesterase [Chloroflexota bacterium]
MVRAFVAIELPQAAKEGLAAIQEGLKKAGRDVVRWVSPEAIHLTLKFLGEIPEDMAPQVKTALEVAAAGMPGFRVETGELGFFPNASRPRVFWVGLVGDIPELLRLQENVEVALEVLGFQREARAFSPHLTLARFKDEAGPVERRSFAEKALAVKLPQPLEIPAAGLSLMRSVLKPTGAVYTRLEFVPLAKS